MNLVHSKDIYYIMRDVLKLLDSRGINHGERTAYIYYRMLQCLGIYEEYELAEFAMIGMLHDIGALKTNPNDDVLKYETAEAMPHSIYGYLFLSYLTPFKDRAKVLLYHHNDYTQIPKNTGELTDPICFLNVAEKMDIYSNILGEKFDYTMFQKHSGTKYSPKALDVLYQAVRKYDVFEKIKSGEYKSELAALWEYLIFTDEEKEGLLTGLMYCVGFRSEYTMLDMVTCVCVCEQLGEKLRLTKEDMEILRLAAVLHDAGMLAIDREIIEAPRRLTDDEMNHLKTHVNELEAILKGRIDREVLDIISAHHERGDGSGYPNRLRDQQMTRLQRILQISDMVTGLTSKRSYREPKPKSVVISILNEEADKGKLNNEIVKTVTAFYDRIMEGVSKKSEETLTMYNKLKENYDITYKQINK